MTLSDIYKEVKKVDLDRPVAYKHKTIMYNHRTQRWHVPGYIVTFASVKDAMDQIDDDINEQDALDEIEHDLRRYFY